MTTLIPETRHNSLLEFREDEDAYCVPDSEGYCDCLEYTDSKSTDQVARDLGFTVPKTVQLYPIVGEENLGPWHNSLLKPSMRKAHFAHLDSDYNAFQRALTESSDGLVHREGLSLE